MDETLEAGVVLVRGSAAGFAQEIRAGRHRLSADEPVADGGTDTGPGPYDLLLGAIEREISLSGALASSLCLDVRRLVEADPVTEWVDDLDAKRAAVGTLDTRAKVGVVLGQQLRVIGRKAPHAYEDGRSRASVAVVLGEVEDESITRHLHVEWELGLKAVLPVKGEVEEVEIELLGLGDVEDAEDRSGLQGA